MFTLILPILSFFLLPAHSFYTGAFIGSGFRANTDDADAYCMETYSSHLATIKNELDQHFARSSGTSAGTPSRWWSGNLWIGLTDEETEYEWVWRDGTEFIIDESYSSWAPNEPNHEWRTHDCVAIRNFGYDDEDYWIDYHCTDEFYFICNCYLYIKVEQVPLPYDVAQIYCETIYSSTIAIINNPAENSCAYQTAYHMTGGEMDVYIGVKYDELDEVYKDSNGNIVDVTQYGLNSTPRGRNLCVKYAKNGREERWSTANCDEELPFMCNVPPTLDAPTRAGNPAKIPSVAPSTVPSVVPSTSPSSSPSASPTLSQGGAPQPESTLEQTSTLNPSNSPSAAPSQVPSAAPSVSPSTAPNNTPTQVPSAVPSNAPSTSPTSVPTQTPSNSPSAAPSSSPTAVPTQGPSNAPSTSPTAVPTQGPSTAPSNAPSSAPSNAPTDGPSNNPSNAPSTAPSNAPSSGPTVRPSDQPTGVPSNLPSGMPSDLPSNEPTGEPSDVPSGIPSNVPSEAPTVSEPGNITFEPTEEPTEEIGGGNENVCEIDFDQCSSSPMACKCNEVENCSSRACFDGEGCTECRTSYWKFDDDYNCISCSVLDGCDYCEDFIGCARSGCRSGYVRYFDEDCNVYACRTR